MDALIDAVIDASFKNAKNLDQLVNRVIEGTYEFKEIKKDVKNPKASETHTEGCCNHVFKKGNLRNMFCNGKVVEGTLCSQHSRKKGQKKEIPKEYTLQDGFIVTMNGNALTQEQKLHAVSKGYPIQCTSTAKKTGGRCSNKCCSDGEDKFICNVHFRQTVKAQKEDTKKKNEKETKKGDKKSTKKEKDDDDTSSDSDSDEEETRENRKKLGKLLASTSDGKPIVLGKDAVAGIASIAK